MKLKKYFFNTVTSTNDIAIKKIRQKKISGIIIAKKQTRGRGRYGNKWISMKNNLFMSIFFKLNNNINLHKLTYNCCKIVRKSLMELINCKITIKKPNDLMIKKKRYVEFYKKLYFIKIINMYCGVGINIDNSPNIIDYPTSYLNQFYKKKLLVFKSIMK